jgi:hypothetical protein
MIAPPARGLSEAASLEIFETWLRNLSANQGNYIRVWLSNPFWDVEHEASGAYDAAKAKRIDRMLELCRRYGIRVKMTLEHFRSIGAEVRQPWADKAMHHVSRGGPAKSIADFFDGDAPREQFKRKIGWYAGRYGDDPIVFGWELWNEVNAVRGGDYLAWTAVMLPELRRAFPREIKSYDPGRPVLLAESGAVEPRHSGPFKLYADDREGVLLHDVLFAPFFAGAAGPGQIWHWDVYVAKNNLWHHFGRFAEAVKGLDPPAENFEPAMIEHPRLRVYALKGRRSVMVWCRDIRNDWRSELEKGEKPEFLRGLNVDLQTLLGDAAAQAQVFDPWQGKWSTARLRKGRVTLPPFTRSIVLRISR